MTARVLFLDHVGVLGGAELSLLDIARHHAGSSTVALMADGPFGERLRAAGVRTVLLTASAATRGLRRESAVPSPAALAGLLGVARAVARLARAHDVIYANSQKAFVVATAAGAAARRPVIWHLRDILSGEHFSRTNVRAVVALANGRAARVVANSCATADAFVGRGGRAGKVRVVYNGIDAAAFAAVRDADAAAARAALGLGDAPAVGVFGRLSPWKGQHVLLDALPRLPGVHALVVGDALFGEVDYATGLRARAAALGVADRVHFLGFRADVETLMRVADVVVHTSVSAEPFGRVIVEGMLAGRPVVATRGGGAVEIVRDGETGALVPPEDAARLAAAIAALLRTDAGAVVAAAGRADAAARFSMDAMLAGVSREITEVSGQ
ncbi:glycosyl transferase [Gemmatimonadetes bacterium T265]|nr:glycosyl transferase [Gemmatimonadetes bacterium T265]